MAVTSERVAVDDTATPLNTPATFGQTLVISTDADVDLGDDSVTFGGGYLLAAADSPLTVQLDAGSELYAIAETSATVQVLST